MTGADQARLQREQLDRYLKWVEEEGGMELPVRLQTFLKPEQQARIRWIKRHSEGEIAEIGCSWGYILACVGGQTGVDINPQLIQLAHILSPSLEFHVGDARDLSFLKKTYDTVLLCEILEHLPYEDVPRAIAEARRVCRKKILITLPVGEHVTSVRHQWVLTKTRLDELLRMLKEPKWVEDKDFVYVEDNK